jgi:protein-disulfide isomerase
MQVGTEGRPFFGPLDAPVTIVEFTDYQCSFCARHNRETKGQLLRQYEGKLRYVVRNFPLHSIHPLAQKAAEAAECAFDQGRFWEYSNLLYDRASEFATEQLTAYAAELGLDTGRFAGCLDSGEKAQVVQKDVGEGRTYGVRSTPAFFVNGQLLLGAKPVVEFQSAIDAALREAGQ